MYKSLFFVLPFLYSYIFPMEFVSNSITPTKSAPLTLEQEQKNEEEKKNKREPKSNNRWQCEKIFKIKKTQDYIKDTIDETIAGIRCPVTPDIPSCFFFRVFDLDQNKVAIAERHFDCRLLKVLDVNSGKEWLVEKDFVDKTENISSSIDRICKLPKNRFACVVETKIDRKRYIPNKIKIYCTESGKPLKDFNFEFNHNKKHNGLYVAKMFGVSDEKLVLLVNEIDADFAYLLILDLQNRAVLLNLSLSDMQKLNIFGTDDIQEERIQSGFSLSDGTILLKSNKSNFCILDSVKVRTVWQSNGLRKDEKDKSTFEFNSIIELESSRLLAISASGTVVIFRNEKLESDKIKEILIKNTNVIPDILDIIINYLDYWDVENKKVGVIPKQWTKFKVYLLNNNKLLFVDSARLEEVKTKHIIFDLITGNFDEIELGSYFCKRAIVLEDGRIIFKGNDSIEIWSEKSKEEDDIQNSGACVIS